MNDARNVRRPKTPSHATIRNSSVLGPEQGELHTADSVRLMPGEPQHGASTHIFQFCTDLVVERALSSRQMRAPEPLHRDRPRKPSQRSGVAQAVGHGLGFT
jgi:hypothetical protein